MKNSQMVDFGYEEITAIYYIYRQLTLLSYKTLNQQTTSDWINQHNLDLGDIIQKIYDRANKIYGTNEKPDI